MRRDLNEGAVNLFFELSYAQYLTIPRSVLDAMPGKWQIKFVELLDELDETYDWRPKSGRYWVRLKDGDGKYVSDPLMDYRHNDAYVQSIRIK